MTTTTCMPFLPENLPCATSSTAITSPCIFTAHWRRSTTGIFLVFRTWSVESPSSLEGYVKRTCKLLLDGWTTISASLSMGACGLPTRPRVTASTHGKYTRGKHRETCDMFMKVYSLLVIKSYLPARKKSSSHLRRGSMSLLVVAYFCPHHTEIFHDIP